MKKIYLSGYYGQNNLGDDYIFYSILDQLSGLGNKIKLAVEIGRDAFDCETYRKLAEPYENITLRFTITTGLKGKLKKIFSIVKSDTWIVGGGWTVPHREC